MHSFETKGFTFVFNGDYSGDVIISSKDTGKSLDIDCEQIFQFVAEAVRSQKISEIENTNYKKLLGL